MRIVDIRKEIVGDTGRIAATAVWERRKKAPQEIYVSVRDTDGDMLVADPNAFLVGALLPAMYHFERRIAVEGSVSGVLAANLGNAMALMNRWYRDAPVLAIEADIDDSSPRSMTGRHSALMFSGGLDSLASLKVNRDRYTPDRHEWFEYGLVVASGFDAFDTSPDGPFWSKMEAVAEETSLDLIPVNTNLRVLEPADHFFLKYLHGALLATVGHALTSVVSQLAIASTDPDPFVPWGSHPSLDPLYTSQTLSVIHDMPTTDRFEKTKLIADWPAARHHMKVCLVADRLPEGKWNCGNCEKCVRTMLCLTALSRLDSFDVFDEDTLTPDEVDKRLELAPRSVRYYGPIIEAFEQIGDESMVKVLRQKMADGRARPSRDPLFMLREFEKTRVGGALRQLRRRLLSQ